jgi:methionyl-tRNA formyltransferase
MNNNRKWIALFSHTGKEIYNISKKSGKWPDSIITNKTPGSEDICPSITNEFSSETGNEVIYCSTKPSVAQYRQLLDTDAIVTLHGWMQIIPGVICEEYEIYNLHPGLITQYPELKGKDPQKKVAEDPNEGKYKNVGCVIHKASAEIDSGEVIMERSTYNVYPSENKLTEHLHEMAQSLWVDFFDLYESGRLDEIL